ncbi:DUF1642 domain-containing protein [Carnobacterium maltaromaticum]|uniref:DUF1642 domain-containing protein n=1 Tax=Carnobacterium maltaromaticum TaxID=2751 RepID=UPI00165C6244|nr:DUF1642 domain-containing protein [Carnobacterium maltaromaticum]MBC9808736.1 DUF1642 domain-containing protein [Carnobacterium maltaromaticum]
MRYWYRQRKPNLGLPPGWVAAKDFSLVAYERELTDKELLEYDLEIWEDEELTEIKKVVIPKFIAEAMQGYDSLEMMLGEEYYSNSSEEIGNDDIQCWIDDIQCWIDENFETLCRAWLDGYEVKKEKLYYVKLPVSIWNNHLDELETNWGYLQHDITSNETNICIRTRGEYANFRTELTEETIKSIDERYWAFAVEAEG